MPVGTSLHGWGAFVTDMAMDLDCKDNTFVSKCNPFYWLLPVLRLLR
jgi:hypothetical protein